MADGLTEAAKAEIAAAIKIVREDKFEQHARGVFAKFAPKEEKKDELITPDPKTDEEKAKETVTPPPAKEEEKEKVKEDEKSGRYSKYWGEILE